MKLKGKVKELKIYSAKEIRGQIQKHELIELRRYDYNGHLIERCYNRELWTGDDESKVIGCKTINKYDENDRIIYSCNYEDGEISLETTYKYTSNGMLAEIYSEGDCPDNDKTTYKYTSKGMLSEICCMFDRLTFMYDSMGNKTKRNQFDDSGKLISSKEWKYDENGSLIEIIRRKENHITYRKIYDKHGHLVGYGSYNGEIKITYEYNEKGYLILAKEKNERTKYVYNGNGQLVARYIIYGSNEDCDIKILYKYDDHGNLIEKRSFSCVLDYALGSISAYGKILEFLIAEETWLYDNIGNLKEYYRNIEDDSDFHLYHIDSMDGAYDEIDLFDDEINDDESDELNDDERDARNDDERDYSVSDEELAEVIKKIKNYDMKGNIIEDFHFEGNNQLFSVGRFYEYTYHEDSLFLFFDTETTGLPKDYNAPISDLDNWPRLVQLSWKLSDENGKQISYGNYIVKPSGFVISEKATEIHGITTDFAKKNGVALCEALRLFSDDLKKATIIVGHNVSFDKKVIGAEMLRTGSEDIVNQKKSICTMKSSIDFCAIKSPYGYKYPSLQELYFKLFGTTFSDAHDSSVDIAATEKCFWELKRRKVVKI